MAITLTVNGQTRTVGVEPDTPLLWLLRDTLGLTGTKFGCGIAACGACTVHLYGRAVRTCTPPVPAAEGMPIPAPANPPLKDPDTYTIRRTAKPRFDIPPKVNGGVRYGIDFPLPGMLYAAVDIAPVEGGRLLSVDPAPAKAKAMPGVKQVVELEAAVAVVADSYWRARWALAALSPVYVDAGHGDVSNETIFAAFDAALGAAPEMPAEAARVITADYRVPFRAHATMEPMTCTVRVENGRAYVWAGTQDPLNARSIAASALDFHTDQVQLTHLMLGGGYGRRLPFSFDYVDLAARIAKTMSPAPVKLVWSRGPSPRPLRRRR